MKEKFLPTVQEKEDAAKALGRWLGIDINSNDAADRIRSVLETHAPGIERAYAERLSGGAPAVLANDALPRFLVDMMGIEMFEGKAGALLRKYLLCGLQDKMPMRLLRLYSSTRGSNPSSSDTNLAFKYLADQSKTRWLPGRKFALEFVDTLNIPRLFGGSKSDSPPERIEEVYPRSPYHDLASFQMNMKVQVLAILKSVGPKRAIVTLPTGAGKTRIAAEATVEFWKAKPDNTRFVLWIAQTDELCEQAVVCFRQLWEAIGTESVPLRIYRAWKSRGLPHPTEEGIIVAGISQLNEIAKSEHGTDASSFSNIRNHLAAVFVDEAHKSWSPEYLRVLDEIGIDSSPSEQDNVPLIGLTATPMRTAANETEKLDRLYGHTRIYPNNQYEPKSDDNGRQFDKSWSDLSTLQEKLINLGYLARPRYYYLEPSKSFTMSDKEEIAFERFHGLDKSLLRRIGTDHTRNAITYDLVKNWVEKDRQVLFFGANVHQALLISRFLEDDGIRSATITGQTRYPTRKSHIRMFREGEIRVLSNYEVLATGFDAPKVDTVIIARPTSSRIVYQQMIGRGLRGKKFGGTETCDIITIADTIMTQDSDSVRLAYRDYKDSVTSVWQNIKDSNTFNDHMTGRAS